MSTDNLIDNILATKDDSHTISYKVGRAILDAKSLKGLVQLPLKLKDARREHLERKAYKELPNKVRSHPDISLESIYNEYGIKGLVIVSKLPNSDTFRLAKELTKLSSSIEGMDRVLISRLALELDESLAVLRGAAWSAVHLHRPEMLQEVLIKLKEGDNLSNKEYSQTYKYFKKRLNKIENNSKKDEIKPTQKHIKFESISKILDLSLKEKSKVKDLLLSDNLDRIAKNENLLSKIVTYLYQAGGIKAVKKGIDKIFFTYSSSQKAFLYLKAGKLLNTTSINAEYELAMLALETDNRMSILRGAFWASQRKGNFKKTAELIELIEAKHC